MPLSHYHMIPVNTFAALYDLKGAKAACRAKGGRCSRPRRQGGTRDAKRQLAQRQRCPGYLPHPV